MKKIKALIIMFVAIFACIGIASCGSDNNDDNNQATPKSLVGTTWSGTNTSKKWACTVTFKSETTYHLKVTSLDGKTVYEEKDYAYTYNAETGAASAVYGSETYAVMVKGNTMSLTMDGKTLTLTKQ